VEENRRDELLEAFQTRHQPGTLGDDDHELLEELDDEDYEVEPEE
jgi:hypothetical protein